MQSMKVILTLEGMWVIVNTLDLNGSVIDFVLSTANVSRGIERFEGLLGDYVATE